jgi:hypothetical protein
MTISVVRETRAPIGLDDSPRVEWREPDKEPVSVTNVGASEQPALRIELKLLGR